MFPLFPTTSNKWCTDVLLALSFFFFNCSWHSYPQFFKFNIYFKIMFALDWSPYESHLTKWDRLNCATPLSQSYAGSPNSKCLVFGDRGPLGDNQHQVRLWGGSLHDGISVLIRKTQREPKRSHEHDDEDGDFQNVTVLAPWSWPWISKTVIK